MKSRLLSQASIIIWITPFQPTSTASLKLVGNRKMSSCTGIPSPWSRTKASWSKLKICWKSKRKQLYLQNINQRHASPAATDPAKNHLHPKADRWKRPKISKVSARPPKRRSISLPKSSRIRPRSSTDPNKKVKKANHGTVLVGRARAQIKIKVFDLTKITRPYLGVVN